MAHGSIQKPEGKDFKVQVYGVSFSLTFIVTRSVDKVAYECLLGRPFLRISRLVMDFDRDVICLRKYN